MTATTTALVESGDCDAELAKSRRHKQKKADLVLAEKHFFAEGRVLEGQRACRYYTGIGGVAEDPDQGYFWAKKAADGGHEHGQYYLGLTFSEGLGTAQERHELVASSPVHSTYGMACSNLGAIYCDGEVGVPSDNSKVATWYLKAAEAGDAISQFALAMFYKAGRGVPKDLAVARGWFQKAAAQEDPDAMFELGRMETQGISRTLNTRSRLELLLRAFELGVEGASTAIESFKNSVG